jgi:hypothetical protein
MAAPRHQAGAILVDAGHREEPISGLDPHVRAIGASSAGMNRQDIVAETMSTCGRSPRFMSAVPGSRCATEPERQCRPAGVLLLYGTSPYCDPS